MIEQSRRRWPASASGIAQRIEGDIIEGRFHPDDRLPSIRELAAHVGVSPATVSAAYASLAHRGLVVAAGRQGTRVAPGPSVWAPWAAPAPPGVRDLATGSPDPALLPDNRRALAAAASSASRLYGAPADDPDLVALAARRMAADGVAADDLAVVSGAMDGVERVLSAHLRPGDRVIVEDPGYPAVRDVLAALGFTPVPVDVDDDGLVPGAFAAAVRAGAHAAVLTPRAQNPLGAALTEDRAAELAAIAATRPEMLLVEDDHAGPISGAPGVTLAGQGKDRRSWAVVRSVSKSYGPDLRVAVIAGDPTTVARVKGRQAIGPGWVSHLLQRTVVALWRDRTSSAQVKTAGATYTRRRRALLDALAGHGIAAHGRSGLNVWIPVAEEAAVVGALMHDGWAVRAGERFRLRTGPGVRVTVATLEPAEAADLAAALAAVLHPAVGSRIA